MILKNEDGKLNFIVSTQYAIAYPEKGASIVLNKLAYDIAKRGHNVYVFDEPYFPHENIKVIPTKLQEDDNPFKSKFICPVLTTEKDPSIFFTNKRLVFVSSKLNSTA